jgi:hypothetical protein
LTSVDALPPSSVAESLKRADASNNQGFIRVSTSYIALPDALSHSKFYDPDLRHIQKALDGGISSRYGHPIRRPSSPLTDIDPLNMTLVSSDPSLWPLISYLRESSYFDGSWNESCLVQSLMCFHSCMPHCSGIRLGCAQDQCLSRELLTESLYIYPALTFGQEVG